MKEDDSNDEKSGTEVGSCVKGSRSAIISKWCRGVQFRSSAAVVVGLIQVSVRQKRSGLWVSIRSDSAAE